MSFAISLSAKPRSAVLPFGAAPVRCRVLPSVRPKTVDIAIRWGGLTRGKTLQRRAFASGVFADVFADVIAGVILLHRLHRDEG